MPIPLPVMDALFSANQSADSESWLLVRVRSNSTMPDNGDVQIKAWAAPFHTEITFPSTFTNYTANANAEYVTVKWGTSSSSTAAASSPANCTGANCDWVRVYSSATANIYKLKWRVKGAQHPKYKEASGVEHFCIRAAVSANQDFRPSLFEQVPRSNNLAQLNVYIQRMPLQMGNVVFGIEAVNGVAATKRLSVTFTRELTRTAYLYEPPSNTQLWADDGADPWPPDVGTLYTLPTGESRYDVLVPSTGIKLLQLITDNSSVGPGVAGEKLYVRQGQGGLQIDLGKAGFRESFEWGIPATWSTSGLWRSVDKYSSGTCGSALTGRKAAAFNNNNESCTFNSGGQSVGELTSPQFTVPNSTGDVFLRFAHWSQTEGSSYYDQRKVFIRPSGGSWTLLATYGAPDTGGVNAWKVENINLNTYKGQAVNLNFVFDSVDAWYNDYRGWYVDDVEVE